MQVQSVGSAQNFVAYGRHSRENIDNFLAMSDRDLQNLAALKTAAVMDDRKHKRKTGIIWSAVPVSAGIGAAMLTKGSNALRIGVGLGQTARWAGMFAVIDLAMLGMNALKNDSKTLGEFDRKHPFMSFLAMFAGSMLALNLTEKGLGKIFAGMKPATKTKFADKLAKASVKLNTSKFLNSVRTSSRNMISKMPKAVKSAGKFTLGAAPFLLMLGALSNSFDYSAKRNAMYAKNYMDLKNKQNMLAAARANELAAETEEV